MEIRYALWGFLACFAAHTGQAQVVQLPTQRVFTMRTTVSVPDRGQATLGGVHSARSASAARGVPVVGHLPGLGPVGGSRTRHHHVGTGQADVRATVIDLQAMDEALLAGGVPRDISIAAESALQRKARFLTRHVARNPRQPAPGLVETR